MEKEKRVLAYTLAQTMNNDELGNVSGGSGALGSRTRTFKFTGVHGPDLEYDHGSDD